MAKKIIRLTESDLHNIVGYAVRKCLKEEYDFPFSDDEAYMDFDRNYDWDDDEYEEDPDSYKDDDVWAGHDQTDNELYHYGNW